MALSPTQKFFGGSSQEGQSIDPGQNQFLQDLFRRASSASFSNTGQNFAQQFQNPAFEGFQNLLNGGGGVPGSQDLQDIASGKRQNTALQGEIDAGLNDITRNFQQNLLPGINTGAGISGGSGGSRQGIAQGVATGEANRNASDFVSRLRSQNFQTGLDAQIGAANQLGTNFATQTQGQLGALNQAGNLSNLGFGSQFGNLSNLKNLLGSPITLGGGGESTDGVVQGLGNVFSFGF